MFLACLNYISVPDRDFEPIRPFRVQPDTALRISRLASLELDTNPASTRILTRSVFPLIVGE